ncbi:MAG TPA: DUF2779 domain-containing protein [Thermotogota bacterium]|nr:DUF2779 domain-containing protein [Thermotogota bacterium]OQC30041.1 MAG: hypothetical protein BWX67_02004 [Thermotogota bacterium ADurb.Bin062]HOF24186.1 DUF2779 domain-containing protein [Thermotogota bacterium]HOM55039.1 DUF2779 domain-containing protein [Thermotogota bacterium]HOS25399.1 DUF2779 domain-containing protein [Thermotogota bacterium]
MNGNGSNRLITKRAFLNAKKCPRLGWETMNGAKQPLTLEAEYEFFEGNQIGGLAKKRFQNGIEIADRDPYVAENETRRVIGANPHSVLFEPAFIHRQFVARADILVPTETGFSILEVKAAMEQNLENAQGKEYLEDIAYTIWVCRSAGITISSANLWFLSRAYRYGDCEDTMFAEIECLALAEPLIEAYEADSGRIEGFLLDTRPDPLLRAECKGCERNTECFTDFYDHTIFQIPRITSAVLQGWIDEGITRVEQIEEPTGLNANQERVRQSIITGQPFLDSNALEEELCAWRYPIAYLDFETIAPAVPILPNTKPYEQIVTQFSLHIAQNEGDSICSVRSNHHEYLADPLDLHASVIGLAEAMVNALPTEGSIMTYHQAFEEGRIRWLMNWLTDQGEEGLARQLEPLLERLVDLEIAIKAGYYHPDFRGSYSIKGVLPVMIPCLTYTGLAVNKGRLASCVFSNMVLGREKEVRQKGLQTPTREDLKKYCELDTWAMVELHRKLLSFL